LLAFPDHRTTFQQALQGLPDRLCTRLRVVAERAGQLGRCRSLALRQDSEYASRNLSVGAGLATRLCYSNDFCNGLCNIDLPLLRLQLSCCFSRGYCSTYGNRYLCRVQHGQLFPDELTYQ